MTGTSRGLGLDLVRRLLERGDRGAATTCSSERLLTALGDGADTSRLLPLTVDLRDEAQVKQAVHRTIERFGGPDVVMNNAGYGFLTAVEEPGDRDVRDMLDDHLKLQDSHPGDPAKGAEAIINRGVTGQGPLRRILGSDSHAYATAKVQALQADLDATADTAPTTDFPATI
ncbi:SDR family NAD(P)-dependent oxidoreductase [Streptomyces chlorus]|uniref:SDR family NAD(P)-dependent oxidoreductase n=1 Tax=Streptomyces chlorus TaxID=887452 RepID=A0ABW1E3H8_9ACTN